MPAMGMKREQGDCQQMLFALPAQALAAPATVNKSRRSMPVPPVSATLRRGDDRLSLVHGVVCNMQLFAGGLGRRGAGRKACPCAACEPGDRPAAFRACCAGVFLTVCGVRMATSCALSSHAGWRGGSALLSHQTVEDRCSKCILPFPGFPALALPSPFPCG